MFCPNCGSKIEDSAKFCTECGSAVSTNEVPVPAQTPVFSEAAANSPADGRAVVKKMAKSGLFLAAAILLTAGISINLLINIGTLFAADSLIASYYGILVERFGYADPQMVNIASGIAMGSIAGTLTGSIPWILNIIGVWITFGSASKKENLCPSTTGLTLCKGVSIANLVIQIIAFAVGILCALLLLIVGGIVAFNTVDSEFGIIFMVIGGVLAAILIPFFVFDIIYCVKILKTIKAVTTTIKTGMPTASVSRFVIVMCFLTGGVNGITSLVSLSIGGMAVAAAFIIFGVILLKYRKQMTYLRDNGNFTAEITTEISVEQ